MNRHGASEATRGLAGVADDVAIWGFRSPGRAARAEDDARRSVTFSAPELEPWNVRVEFLVYEDDESDELLYVCAGHALEKRISLEDAERDPGSVIARCQQVTARFARHLDHYIHLGELLLRDHSGVESLRWAVANGKAHKNHRLLVAEFRALAGTADPITTLADRFMVDRSTIFRELREAEAGGLLRPGEIKRRGKRRA